MAYIERKQVLELIANIMQDCKVGHKHRALNRNIKQIPTADVVEVETIKAWLYEIAINNVGCDGDFSNACEEIIARIDGLRNFAKERSEGDG